MSRRTQRAPAWVAGAVALAALAQLARTSRADDDPAGFVAAQLGDRQVGRQLDGSILVPTNQVLTPAGLQLELPGRPNAIAVSPDGRTAALLVARQRALTVLDLERLEVKQRLTCSDGDASFAGLVYSSDGTRLYASLASGRIAVARVAGDGTLALDHVLPIPPTRHGNPNPGALALSGDGRTLYAVLNRNDTLAAIDLAARRVTREIPVGNAPYGVVLRGDRAYVSNEGGRRATPLDFTNDSAGTPIVADPVSGGAVTGTVSVVDLAAGAEVAQIAVGLHPTEMLLDGGRLFVANTNSDSISVIDLSSDRVERTIAVEPFPGAPFGSSPDALALAGDLLVVSLGRNNALAFYSLSPSGDRLEGLLPTAWYPTALALDGARLLVANGKGVGSLGPLSPAGPPARNAMGHRASSEEGSVSIVDLPDAQALGEGSRAVARNNGWLPLLEPGGDEERRGERERRRGREPAQEPLPERASERSLLKHVFYIVKENRTYDQILGDLPQGNGDPALVQFGRDVTPNQHALAEQFVLLDNFYDSGSNSADGHQWVTQAMAPDYLEKAFGGFPRGYPFNGGDALAYLPTGFLWENARRHGRSVRVYGEYASGLSFSGPPGGWRDFYRDAKVLRGEAPGPLHVTLRTSSDVPSLDALLVRDFPGFTSAVPDLYRAEIFLRELRRDVAEGTVPDLSIISLNRDHTDGLAPGSPTPRAEIADNDLATGRIVDAISHSPCWNDSVIFIVEDDSQGGVDHVDGHRSLGFVVSPYVRRGSIVSRFLSQLDFVRAIEQILGLPPMNQMDRAVDLANAREIFTTEPDPTPFEASPNQVPLDEMNRSPASLRGLRRSWALASAKLDLSHPDRADPRVLNRAIWYSAKGFGRAYPGDRRVLTPEEVALAPAPDPD